MYIVVKLQNSVVGKILCYIKRLPENEIGSSDTVNYVYIPGFAYCLLAGLG
jgi:hypothetical protein